MPPSTEQKPGHFEALPEVRCKELLARHTAGRVGWNAPDGPHILPVTYAYHNTQIVFRTSAHGVLSSLERRTRVAFEIDDIDEEASSGWNVLVRGSAEGVTQSYTLASLWKEGPLPWASGSARSSSLLHRAPSPAVPCVGHSSISVARASK